MGIFGNLIIILLLIVSAAYFALSEISVAGSRKVRLQQMADEGEARAALVLKLKENPGYFFSVIQVGINAVAILGGVLGDGVFSGMFNDLYSRILPAGMHGWLEQLSFTSSFLLVTILFVMFSDLIPKRIAMNFPEAVAIRMIRVMLVLIWILKPVVWALTGAANIIMRVCGIPLHAADQITNEDIVATVEAGAQAGVIAPIEHTAITNMMELESHYVPSAMTARDSIIYFTLDEDFASISRKIEENPHDHFLVVDKDIDHVVGCVGSKYLVTKLGSISGFKSLKDSGLVEEAITIPDSLTLTETLDLFKRENNDFAVIINEYGLTVGVITLKDILWMVMGNYVTSPDEAQMVQKNDGTWVVEGVTPVDDIEREFDIESLPEEETYETVAGFMMYMLRRVPKRGDHVEYAGYRFEVISTEGFHIDKVLVRRAGHGAESAVKPCQKKDETAAPAAGCPTEKATAETAVGTAKHEG